MREEESRGSYEGGEVRYEGGGVRDVKWGRRG